jgi:hypothetical protein
VDVSAKGKPKGKAVQLSGLYSGTHILGLMQTHKVNDGANIL